MRIGAHVPTRGRLASAIGYARAIGAETFQIFVGNPRAWAPPRLDPDQVEEFLEARSIAGLGPVLIHCSYLVNIASPNPNFLRRSIGLARAELEAAAAIGGDALVVHAGAGGAGERPDALERAAAAVRAIAGAGDGPLVLLELTAGGAGAVASTLSEAAKLLDSVDHPRVALCLDTCHLFAAGYPLDDPDARSVASELASLGLASRVFAIHANDSRDPRGSRRDRHAHPGRGQIGEPGLSGVLSDRALRHAAALCEVPGSTQDHAADVDTLRRLAGV